MLEPGDSKVTIVTIVGYPGWAQQLLVTTVVSCNCRSLVGTFLTVMAGYRYYGSYFWLVTVTSYCHNNQLLSQ